MYKSDILHLYHILEKYDFFNDYGGMTTEYNVLLEVFSGLTSDTRKLLEGLHVRHLKDNRLKRIISELRKHQ